MAKTHKWTFAARFRRHSFGWRSQPAIARIKEAVSEIKKVDRDDPILAAEGAVLLIEKLSPALEQVDSSSGSIGTAVNHALECMASIIGKAPADEELRQNWLERIWEAIQDDDIPYLEPLTDYWGELCSTPERASRWADAFIGTVRKAWSPDPELRGYFKGTTACLSALLKGGRNEEILQLLALAPYKSWHDRKYGVRALAAMGRKDEALLYAEESRGLNESPVSIARACEEILLSSGMIEEAYRRYAVESNQAMTHLATFRAVVEKYPHKDPGQILRDLVASTPGQEGKWFAAAKSARLYREAIGLANRTPCDPRTLIRAARDMVTEEPQFSLEAGMAALRWLSMGYGYDITGAEVWAAYQHTISAADRLGCRADTIERIRNLISGKSSSAGSVVRVLGRELGLSDPGTRGTGSD